MAEAWCTGLDRCCELAGYQQAKQDCHSRHFSDTHDKMLAAISAGARFDPAAASACVEAIETAIGNCLPFKQKLSGWAACARIYTGGVLPPGADCKSWDCADTPAGQGICVTTISSQGVEMTCQTFVTVGPYEECSFAPGSFVWCPLGFDCRDEDDSGVARCLPPRSLGSACPDGALGDMCELGATCASDTTKTCVPALPIGAPCTDATQCEAYKCDGLCRLNPHFVPFAECVP